MKEISMIFLKQIMNINLIIPVLSLAGIGLFLTSRYKKTGQAMLAFSSVFVLFVVSPIPYLSAVYLENYYSPVREIPDDVKGMIILGGSFDLDVTASRGTTSWNQAGGRLIQGIELARARPHLKIIFTGAGRIKQGMRTESELASEVFRNMGLDPDRVVFEDKSRNTLENALFSAELVKPEANEKWLLVTSAIHMPRAVGLFRHAGWNVVPYPVDYHTTGDISGWSPLSVYHGVMAWTVSMIEWFGMLANFLFGYSSSFLPDK